MLSDASPEIRELVIVCFVGLVSSDIASLQPYLSDIASVNLHALTDEVDSVAIAACEFWIGLAHQAEEHTELLDGIGNMLPEYAEAACVSSRLTALVLGWCKRFYLAWFTLKWSSQLSQKRTLMMQTSQINRLICGLSCTGTEKMIRYIVRDVCTQTSHIGPQVAQYTLRKMAASVLDDLATHFGPDFVEVFLPPIQSVLSSPESHEWTTVEAAICAVGAIAENCLRYVAPHLPELIPTILRYFAHPKVLDLVVMA